MLLPNVLNDSLVDSFDLSVFVERSAGLIITGGLGVGIWATLHFYNRATDANIQQVFSGNFYLWNVSFIFILSLNLSAINMLWWREGLSGLQSVFGGRTTLLLVSSYCTLWLNALVYATIFDLRSARQVKGSN
jgi:hypothetical protein